MSLDFSDPESSDPFAHIRVPLLPDNFAPDRSQLEGHLPEETDGPIPAPEISVTALHPENVVPAALTEVESINPDGVELSFMHDEEENQPTGAEGGMIRDIWHGLMDDLFGPAKTPAKS
jgi:hypothetical protein